MFEHKEEIEMLLKFWPVFLTFILLVVWQVRMEAKLLNTKERLLEHINGTEKGLKEHKDDVKNNQVKVWDKIETIKDQNTEILTAVSRLEGKFETILRETN